MARIRSIHPGLYTDEAYVSLSMAARVFLPGIWTECDDGGVFEWKPTTLKMKLFPADSIDVVPLLDELLAADSIRKFEAGGKVFGVARNFRKYQKPKNPSYRFELPEEYRQYVGLNIDANPGEGEDSPSPTEVSSQMEDGGGNRRGGDTSSLRSDGERAPQKRLSKEWKPSAETLSACKTAGLSESEINRELMRFRNHAEQSDRRCASWDAAFRNWCMKAAEDRGKSPPDDGVHKEIFVPLDSPQWGYLSARWREENKTNTGPPARDYPVGTGWYFPKEWAAA